jgi:hypothetical protein
MSDPFKEFVEDISRLTVPEDDTDESRGRREAAASELGTPISKLDESNLIACAADDGPATITIRRFLSIY